MTVLKTVALVCFILVCLVHLIDWVCDLIAAIEYYIDYKRRYGWKKNKGED